MFKNIFIPACLSLMSLAAASTCYALQSPTNFVKNGPFYISHCFAEDSNLNGGALDGKTDSFGMYNFCTPQSAKIIEGALKRNPEPNFANHYVLIKVEHHNPEGREIDKAYYYAAANTKNKRIAVFPFIVSWNQKSPPPLIFKKNDNKLCTNNPNPDDVEYVDDPRPVLSFGNADEYVYLSSKKGELVCVSLKENKMGYPYWDTNK